MSATTLAATSKSASEQPAGAATSGVRAKRIQLVNDFLLRCLQETQHKLLKKHIWSAVGHRSPRQFQYWQAGDDRSRGKIRGATDQDDQNFRRILAMAPADFEKLLKKKSVL